MESGEGSASMRWLRIYSITGRDSLVLAWRRVTPAFSMGAWEGALAHVQRPIALRGAILYAFYLPGDGFWWEPNGWYKQWDSRQSFNGGSSSSLHVLFGPMFVILRGGAPTLLSVRLTADAGQRRPALFLWRLAGSSSEGPWRRQPPGSGPPP